MTAVINWRDDAFFSPPDRDSVDGGTTSSGPLWHSATARWGHSMHTMCSYHGMFPAKLAHYFIQQYSNPGDVVFDPFSGRGTVALQARIEGRTTVSNDLSPLAYVLTLAKTNPPPYDAVISTIDGLEAGYQPNDNLTVDVSDDIRMLYHSNTLTQIAYLRDMLLSKPITAWSPDEAMIAGCLAGIMHGSHRRDGTSQYLSISMPNTFSMSPTYVAKFIREKGLTAPDQNVFDCVRDKVARIYLDSIEGCDGQVFHHDAAELMAGPHVEPQSVDLVVTSPPYLQVVNYGTANWIRLWLIGVDEVGRERGRGRKTLDATLDHRHTYDSYRLFLLRTLQGIERVLKRDGVAALVIGDVAGPGRDPVPLAKKVWEDVGASTNLRLIELIEDHIAAEKKVSRIWGDTKGQATDRDCVLVLSHKDGRPQMRQTSIEWDEPYKDGGPDAAHMRLKSLGQRSGRTGGPSNEAFAPL